MRKEKESKTVICSKTGSIFIRIVLIAAATIMIVSGIANAGETDRTEKENTEKQTTKKEISATEEKDGEIPGTQIISVASLGLDNVMIRNIEAGTILPEKLVKAMGEDIFFYTEEITDETFERMWKKSFKEDCTTPREDLRYIRCLHCDIDGNIKVGELVMHECVADVVCEIFRKLYDEKYPIESMILVDEFDASDEMSIMSNNTSAFNFRMIDSTDQISNHAYGLAIDINPYYNVYYIPSANYVFPPEGWEYLDREADFPYKLEPGDLCYNLFTEAGFNWGGWWTYNTDYQHFEYIVTEGEQ